MCLSYATVKGHNMTNRDWVLGAFYFLVLILLEIHYESLMRLFDNELLNAALPVLLVLATGSVIRYCMDFVWPKAASESLSDNENSGDAKREARK
jgi:hypothetical protein